MAVCAGKKRDGSPCTATVEPPRTHCWWHDPANAEARRRAASKGGRAKPNGELADVKARLSSLADDVLEGRQDKGAAAVASQILNVYLRALTVEMKAREVEELERRLEELEDAMDHKEGRWGA